MLSRRDFLKLSGAGVLGLLLSGLRLESIQADEAAPVRQGRVAYYKVSVYDAPSIEGKKIAVHKRDEILSILETVIGGAETDYNRRWYRIGEGEYVYSGGIQPVQSVHHKPIHDIPGYGALGEVTVPFVDTYWKPDYQYNRGYRLYYETTHWVRELVVNMYDRGLWYRLYDDRIRTPYYAPAKCLRIIPYEELTPLSPDVPAELKHIRVALAEQLVAAYEDEKPVFLARASTGTRANSTPLGQFQTFHKRSTRHMAGGDLVATSYDLPGVPWVSSPRTVSRCTVRTGTATTARLTVTAAST